ncbi:hypothetical protein [Kutzneria sp. CA-103260]|nr:hypothetical protein [Kutzneria sp. CA-103260]
MPFHLAELGRHDLSAFAPSAAELDQRANNRDQGGHAHHDQYGPSSGIHV